jgi:hypothetical protein
VTPLAAIWTLTAWLFAAALTGFATAWVVQRWRMAEGRALAASLEADHARLAAVHAHMHNCAESERAARELADSRLELAEQALSRLRVELAYAIARLGDPTLPADPHLAAEREAIVERAREWETERDRLLFEREILRDQHTAVLAEQQRQQHELESLLDAQSASEAERRVLLAERAVWQDGHDTLMTERRTWAAERTALLEQCASLQTERNALLTEGRSWQSEHESLLATREQWSAEREAAQLEQGALRLEYEARFAELQARVIERDADLADLQDQLADYDLRFAAQQARLKERDLNLAVRRELEDEREILLDERGRLIEAQQELLAADRSQADAAERELVLLRTQLGASSERCLELEQTINRMQLEAIAREQAHASALEAATAQLAVAIPAPPQAVVADTTAGPETQAVDADGDLRERLARQRLQELEEGMARARSLAREHKIEVAGLKGRIHDLEDRLAQLWARHEPEVAIEPPPLVDQSSR